MLTKQYLKRHSVCKVTFTLPKGIAAQTTFVVGDFNNWDTRATPMKKSRGLWKATIELAAGREYQFRYLVNGTEWHNDNKADGYLANPFGSDNSVVSV